MRRYFYAILVTVAIFCMNLTAYSQGYDIDLRNVTVKEAMQQIKNQTGYSFVYMAGQVDTQKKVSVQGKNQAIESLVRQVLAGQNLTWEVKGKNIVVTPKTSGNKQSGTSARKKVTGTISDESGQPLPGVSVIEKGTRNGTVSQGNGEYAITIGGNSTMVVSCIGFKTIEVPVNGRSSIDLVLKEDKTYLDEVVVVGYGTGKKISSIVGTVATVKSEIVKNAPAASALDQLQGQVAGLTVLSFGGVSGDNNLSITLHGTGSLGTSASPLIVIDGLPSSQRSVMAMNPNDIASISVLKDASATSIYGSRAANGVIYITTKIGSYSEKASVTVRSQWGVNTLANLRLYRNMMNGEQLKKFWVDAGLFTADWIKTNFTDKGYDANTKWYKEFMDLVVPQSQNDISIEGGGKKISYMIGASQYYQKGFTYGNYYHRYTLRNNLEAHPFEWLKVGSNINISLDDVQQNPYWGSSMNGQKNSLRGGFCYFWNPLWPNDKNEEGNWYTAINQPTQKYYMDNHVDKYKTYGIISNIYVEIDPIKNLKLVSRGGVDGNIMLNNWHTNPSYTQLHGGTAYAGKRSDYSYTATITNTAEYIFTVADDYNFSVLVGQEGIKNHYENFYSQAAGQTDDRVLLIQNGTADTRAVAESNTESKFLSFFGRVSFDYGSRYMVDATVRNDAVSRFGSNKRNAFFWSLGTKWNAKKESFMQDVQWVNAADLKVSYGTQGNAEIGDYPSLGLISNSGTYDGVSARYVTQPANPDLTWEKQSLFTVAVSGRIFDMLDIDLDYYYRKTRDMLMGVPQPYTSGFTSVMDNVGSMRNSGVDISLGIDIIKNRDAYLRFSTVFNYNSQKILSLFEGKDRWEISNTGVTYVKGQRVNFYYPIWAGVDKETGAPTWYLPGDDVDKKTTKETTTTFNAAELRQNTGKPRWPPVNGGFSIAGGWKGLSLRADFSFVLDKWIYNNDAFFYENPNLLKPYNTCKDVRDFWTPENTDAEYPDWSKGYTMKSDTHLLENSSFLRLKNLQIAYDLPASLLGWSNNVLKGVKFTVTGRNLLTVTNFSGSDPEKNGNNIYGVAGSSKQVLGGVEITF